jgi:hypothetical protein
MLNKPLGNLIARHRQQKSISSVGFSTENDQSVQGNSIISQGDTTNTNNMSQSQTTDQPIVEIINDEHICSSCKKVVDLATRENYKDGCQQCLKPISPLRPSIVSNNEDYEVEKESHNSSFLNGTSDNFTFLISPKSRVLY